MTPRGTTPNLIYRPMATGLNGYYVLATHTIHINNRYDAATQRATLVHELIHAERGDTACCNQWFEAKQEHAVEREAARRLITVEGLIAGIRETIDDRHLAHWLEVDLDMLHTRLSILSDQEKDRIEETIDHLERTA
jgi:Zn-dependent peptidase ImmA (M78 family)